jgi:hypothetical protein
MSPEAQILPFGLDFPDLRLEIAGELRDAWRVARDEAVLAYRDWCSADEDEVDAAYWTYLAAADREHAAAMHLQRNTEANRVAATGTHEGAGTTYDR